MNMDWTELGSLVTRVQSGDIEAQSELFEKITPYIFSRIRYLLRNEADAEDAVQEVLIEVYKSINNLSDPQAFGGWLKTITLRKCYRYYGKPTDESLPEDNEGLSIDFIDDRQATPVEEIEAQETKDNLRLMIEALPQLQRETMILFYYDNLKIREIAEFMGCSENTVKSRLNYAKRTMEAEISEKRKKGILFPAIMPWPIIFRQLFTEAFEESTGDVGSEVLQRIGENVASELGGMGGTEGLGGTGSGGFEGTGGVGGSVGSGATTAKGLTVATKTIIGIVAAVAAGAILLNNPSEPAEPQGGTNQPAQVVSATPVQDIQPNEFNPPVTDSDYAHIYYDYIQDKLKPTGNFIDADMVVLASEDGYNAPVPYMVVSELVEGELGYNIYQYDFASKQIECLYSYLLSEVGQTMSRKAVFLGSSVDYINGISVTILFERAEPVANDNGTYPIGAWLTTEAVYRSQQAVLYSYVPEEDRSYYPYITDDDYDEIQQVVDNQVGTWSISFGDSVFFDIENENTDGERLRDYFDD